MRIDPDKPGLWALLHGEGDDPQMIAIAWIGTLAITFCFALGIFGWIA